MTGFFSRKAKNKEELFRNEVTEYGDEKRIKVIGEKLLTHETYETFCQNLDEECEFIEAIANECGEEQDGTARCYLFRDETRTDEVIAVNAEGCNYARYAALIRL